VPSRTDSSRYYNCGMVTVTINKQLMVICFLFFFFWFLAVQFCWSDPRSKREFSEACGGDH
jgi:hypothetical protein